MAAAEWVPGKGWIMVSVVIVSMFVGMGGANVFDIDKRLAEERWKTTHAIQVASNTKTVSEISSEIKKLEKEIQNQRQDIDEVKGSLREILKALRKELDQREKDKKGGWSESYGK